METPKEQIIKLDFILTGSIITKYGPCGKESCRCAHDKKHWHGPYYIWTRKENGKTITQSLSKAQVIFCKKAINNMQKLKAQIERWKKVSLEALKNDR
jgi:hypothetical protein